jgi:hypothetical protein
MEAFARAWSSVYDLVFFCPDHYALGADPFRSIGMDLQAAADRAVVDQLSASGVSPAILPMGLTVEDRVRWVSQRVDAMLEQWFALGILETPDL